MTADPEVSTKWLLAYHEAAHAITAFYFGGKIANITFKGDSLFEGTASVKLDVQPPEPDAVQLCRKLGIVTVAGRVAEKRFASQYISSSGSVSLNPDEAKIEQVASYAFGPSNPVRTEMVNAFTDERGFIAAITSQAEGLLQMPSFEAAIHELAQFLFDYLFDDKEITGQEVEDIISKHITPLQD